MKTRTSAAAAVCVFAAVMCVPGTAEAIVGGEQADQPYPVGSLQYDNEVISPTFS
jgi:hypothetical protein